MTIICEELGRNRAPRSSSQDVTWARTYTRTFQILTDDPLIGASEVRKSIPVSIGQIYETSTELDAGAYAQKITATEDTTADDGCQWIGTVEYGPRQALERPPNPLDEQPEISWTWAQFDAVAEFDVDGNPIVNSAGDRFDPPPMRDDSRPVLQLVRNQATFDPDLADAWYRRVNSGPWFGAAAKKWMVLNITGKRVKNADFGWYWVVTYELQYNRDTWALKLLNVGFNQLSGSGKVRIADTRGAFVSDPQPLNSDGTVKAAGSAADSIEFDIYTGADFSDLGFDQFFTDLATAAGS